MSSKRALIAAAFVAVFAANTSADAAPDRVAVMSLRAAPGSVSMGVFTAANNMLWQKLMTVQGIQPLTERQVGDAIGPAYQSLRSCASDDCMLQVAVLANVPRVVWGYVRPTCAAGFRIDLRVVDSSGGLISTASPGCVPCQEAELLGALQAWNPAELDVLGTGRAAPPAVARPMAPPPVAQPPQQRPAWTPPPPVQSPPPAAAWTPPPPLVQPPRAPWTPPPVAKFVPPPPSKPAPGTGSISIKTKPSGAFVSINGRPVGSVPIKKWRLAPGNYKATVALEGYRDASVDFRIVTGRNVKESLKLTPTHGQLIIESDPSEALVRLDGRDAGTTPTSAMTLPVGEHTVEVWKDRHLVETKRFTVSGGPKPQRVRLKLRSTDGTVDIYSKPSGATVTINGQAVGETPLKKFKLPAGTYAMQLWKEGYETAAESVTVQGGKPTKVSVRMESNEGTLSIYSWPSDASVRVDGDFVGATPLKAHVLSRGSHEIVLFKSGFEEHTETVEITGGKRLTLKPRLQKEAPSDGTLMLSSKPSGARVMIDSVSVGETPREIQFRKGSYMVRWILEGFDPVERRVEIKGGKKHKLHANLDKAPPAPGTAELTIETTPSDANVQVSGRPYPGGVADQVLMAGRYDVRISRDGYLPLEFSLTLPDGQRVKVSKTLAKEPPKAKGGYLAVTTDPPGATITMNGTPVGVSPIAKYELRPGFYNITATLDGFDPADTPVEIKSSQTANTTMKLTSRFASLKVSTEPAGAILFLGGEELGTTPGEWNKLKPGPYELLVSKIGSSEQMRKVTLKKGETTTLAIDLSEASGYLTVRTAPPGATVALDGDAVGQSPLSRHRLPPGKYQLEVSKLGFEVAKGEVTIESRKNKALQFTLSKLPEPPPASLGPREKGSDLEEEAPAEAEAVDTPQAAPAPGPAVGAPATGDATSTPPSIP